MESIENNLLGQKFGRLSPIAFEKCQGGRRGWRCVCDCGKEVVVRESALLGGERTSCGCKKRESHPYRGKPRQDLTGQRFGRLVVESCDHYDSSARDSYWSCLCDCGKHTIVAGHSLRRGCTKSCGCYQRDVARETLKQSPRPVPAIRTVHGLRHTRLYGVWLSMKNRCYNEHSKCYHRYGGRGIGICDEWRSNFEAFYNWAIQTGYDENAPKGTCTLDRRDNDADYSPDNCRWRTQKQQCNNTAFNLYLEYNGERHTLSEWSQITGIGSSTIESRLMRYKWSVEKALTTPVRRGRGD